MPALLVNTAPVRRINPEFGEWVTRLFQEHGLSLRAARIRTGIDHVTLSDMAAGYVPRLEQVERLADGFGLDVNEVRERAGYPPVRTSAEPTYEHLLNHTVQAYGGGPIPPEDLEVLEAILRDRAAARERKGR
jgi:transcriptional regulator with XRE-family HTH domain